MKCMPLRQRRQLGRSAGATVVGSPPCWDGRQAGRQAKGTRAGRVELQCARPHPISCGEFVTAAAAAVGAAVGAHHKHSRRVVITLRVCAALIPVLLLVQHVAGADVALHSLAAAVLRKGQPGGGGVVAGSQVFQLSRAVHPEEGCGGVGPGRERDGGVSEARPSQSCWQGQKKAGQLACCAAQQLAAAGAPPPSPMPP